ncbi:fimbrial protein [Erwinia sp. JUb26]|uniref:fimbrial protein n=1 Tax=Erwinia sp. JUb26 TaxID=2485126 RepID=UPI000F47E952|nr:fimbrial protein [Erwinia sp. JUb26]ROR11318.1 type 1 fimbria pilin [Erwinia sp. JUb26]
MRVFLSVMLMLVLSSGAFAVGNNGYGNISIRGVVIDAPCSVAPGDEDLQVNFGQVASASLTAGRASPAQDFSIRLLRCSRQMRNQVRVMFSGSAFSDGLFKPGSTEASFGIAIRDPHDRPVINGQPIAWQALADGDNVLHFSAFLKGRQQTIAPGDFQAQVLFYLEYQ